MCKRTSFQYKVVRVPEDDFYTAAAQQGDPMGTYKDDSRATTGVWVGWAYALSFFDCISLIKIIMPPNDMYCHACADYSAISANSKNQAQII